jgi:hypothetical protein
MGMYLSSCQGLLPGLQTFIRTTGKTQFVREHTAMDCVATLYLLILYKNSVA